MSPLDGLIELLKTHERGSREVAAYLDTHGANSDVRWYLHTLDHMHIPDPCSSLPLDPRARQLSLRLVTLVRQHGRDSLEVRAFLRENGGSDSNVDAAVAFIREQSPQEI